MIDSAAVVGTSVDVDTIIEEAQRRRRSLIQHLPITAIVVGYVWYFTRLTLDIHRGLGSSACDLGLYDQGMLFDGTTINQMHPADRRHATRLMSTGLQDVGRIWYHLGARSFVRAERAEPTVGGEVRLVLPQSGAWTGPSSLVDVAEEYASKPDNMFKLTQAIGYAERHLFVWIDSSFAEPFGAFGSKDLVRGLAEPHVPRAIDAVWLASTSNQVVRWHRQEGWRDFGVSRA